jgi:hypothetical protein
MLDTGQAAREDFVGRFQARSRGKTGHGRFAIPEPRQYQPERVMHARVVGLALGKPLEERQRIIGLIVQEIEFRQQIIAVEVIGRTLQECGKRLLTSLQVSLLPAGDGRLILSLIAMAFEVVDGWRRARLLGWARLVRGQLRPRVRTAARSQKEQRENRRPVAGSLQADHGVLRIGRATRIGFCLDCWVAGSA